MKSCKCSAHFGVQCFGRITEKARSTVLGIFHSFRFDFIFLSLSIFYSFKAVLIFTTFHLKVKRNCFLFADMNDLKRVLTPGPAIACNGHILFSGIACVIAIWLAKRVLDDRAQYLFDSKVWISMVVSVQIFAVLDYVMILRGIEALCHSLVSLKYCNFSGVWAIDFRTFTPRYMKAWSFYADLLNTKFSVCGLALSWMVFIVLHVLQCRRFRKRSDGETGNGYLFQGDMVMSKEQIDIALKGGDVDNPTGDLVFGMVKSNYYKWPNGIVPYVLADSVRNAVLNKVGLKGPSEKAILSAMKEWEKKTCIQFKPRTNEKDYIEFIDDGFGKCWSYVGRIGGKQQISIGFGCFYHGIVVHEIGHALGLHHEQSRPDRDSYVEIIWSNIKKDNQHNFKKYSHSIIDSLGSPYDYGSIMHYGSRDFANWPWQTTIKPKRKDVSIGQRSHLSTQDALQIKKFYECK